eukprot:GHVS01052239.1.p1 GENE.GHVS01052239.1~~GHVS01052239.1.p1  ORF type:complete len:174 (+),score=16.87 GHVS01052239.1:166-687(+)
MKSHSSRTADIPVYSVHPSSLGHSYQYDLHLSPHQLRHLRLDGSRPLEATSIPNSVTSRLSTARPCTAFTTSERNHQRLSDSLSLRQEGSAAFVGCAAFRPDRYASSLYDLLTARPLPPLVRSSSSSVDPSLPFFPKETSDAFDGQQTLGSEGPLVDSIVFVQYIVFVMFGKV